MLVVNELQCVVSYISQVIKWAEALGEAMIAASARVTRMCGWMCSCEGSWRVAVFGVAVGRLGLDGVIWRAGG